MKQDNKNTKIQYLKWIIFLIAIIYFLNTYFNMISEIQLLVVLKMKDKESNK